MAMKRILTALLALSMLLALFACGKTVDADGTPTSTDADIITSGFTRTQSETQQDELPGTQTLTTASSDTSAPTDASGNTLTVTATTAVSGISGVSGGTSSATTKPAVNAPVNGSVAEIVKFYNTVANATKAQKNFSVRKNEKLDCHVTEGALTILDGAISSLRKDNPNMTETFKNGKGTINPDRTPQSFLPPDNKTYMSRLQPEWVKSATCKVKGKGWEIKLVLKTETVPAKTGVPKQHQSCMETLDVDWNDLPVTVLDSTTATNYDATITALVDPGGQILDELHIYEPVKVQGQVQVLVPLDMTVEGYWKQDIWFS
jgi:hypothetical protein